MGCVTQIGEQGWNVGRMAVLAAGWPVDVSATTVDASAGRRCRRTSTRRRVMAASSTSSSLPASR